VNLATTQVLDLGKKGPSTLPRVNAMTQGKQDDPMADLFRPLLSSPRLTPGTWGARTGAARGVAQPVFMIQLVRQARVTS